MRPITAGRTETALRTDDVAVSFRSAPRRHCWLSRSISGRDGGGDVKSGTVGIKADALSSSASTARGAAGGRSTSSDALTLHIRADWTLVLDLKTTGFFRGRQFVLELAALPHRSRHLHPHTASMRPNAHSWSNPSTRFDGEFVFHTMTTPSGTQKTVCVRERARAESSMWSRMDTSA